MRVLLLGSGAREHALAWKIARSPLVDEVMCAPGNPGMDTIGPCFEVAADDVDAIETLTLQLEPGLVVIGPEAALAAGIADRLRARGFDVFGPSQAAAQIETSKRFAKAFMADEGIPTAAHLVAETERSARAALDHFQPPYVLKADGLAAGKGVVIAATREAAEAHIASAFSAPGANETSGLVIEAFMPGEEASLFVLTDGEAFLCLPPVQDHKRVGEGDTGPNTGGMGAYAPAPVMDADMTDRAVREIVAPTLQGLARAGMPYQGVLYVGLMVTSDGPKVVEFNARFGDPECQVLMAGIPGDIVPALLLCATGGLRPAEMGGAMQLGRFRPAAAIVLASTGYPDACEAGSVIGGLEAAEALSGVTVFQAGTDIGEDRALLATGGRVLCVTATGKDLDEAFTRAYAGVDAIDWPEGFCRRDIGWRVRGGGA